MSKLQYLFLLLAVLYVTEGQRLLPVKKPAANEEPGAPKPEPGKNNANQTLLTTNNGGKPNNQVPTKNQTQSGTVDPAPEVSIAIIEGSGQTDPSNLPGGIEIGQPAAMPPTSEQIQIGQVASGSFPAPMPNPAQSGPAMFEGPSSMPATYPFEPMQPQRPHMMGMEAFQNAMMGGAPMKITFVSTKEVTYEQGNNMPMAFGGSGPADGPTFNDNVVVQSPQFPPPNGNSGIVPPWMPGPNVANPGFPSPNGNTGIVPPGLPEMGAPEAGNTGIVPPWLQGPNQALHGTTNGSGGVAAPLPAAEPKPLDRPKRDSRRRYYRRYRTYRY